MKEKRPSKNDDQENTEKAYQLLLKLMHDHPEIETTLWASAVWSCLANGYLNSGLSHDEFKSEANKFFNHCKSWWE